MVLETFCTVSSGLRCSYGKSIHSIGERKKDRCDGEMVIVARYVLMSRTWFQPQATSHQVASGRRTYFTLEFAAAIMI